MTECLDFLFYSNSNISFHTIHVTYEDDLLRQKLQKAENEAIKKMLQSEAEQKKR